MRLQQAVDSIGEMFSGREKHRYSALHGPENSRNERLTAAQRAKGRRYLTLGMIAVAMSLLLLFLPSWPMPSTDRQPRCEWSANCTDVSPHSWGQYSSFFTVPSEVSPDIPDECEVTFALVLSRHGARDPTSSKSDLYRGIIERIQSSVSDFSPGFEFLEDFDYKLGSEQLTEFGTQQMVDSGETFYERYQHLAKDEEPFVRAAGSQRVIDSATNFTKGYYKARGKDAVEDPSDVLVIPEGNGSNNTMDHGTCTAFEEGPASKTRERMQSAWKAIWVLPITARLNKKLPGANLTLDETIYMMDLCPFHVVASPQGDELSPICSLFSKTEWRSYDYFMSLDKWYGYGQGNPLGPTQGVGYVNELIARLTGKAVEDSTSTNSTLDSSPETFPLDRKLYADFSHDNLMASVHAALGLYNQTADLPVDRRVAPEKAGGFSAAWTVPFAGRMYVEKMRCGKKEEELVRVLVNDRVVKLEGCGGDEEGRCELGRFVESLGFAREGGRWDACFS